MSVASGTGTRAVSHLAPGCDAASAPTAGGCLKGTWKMRLRDLVEALHPWYRSRLSSIAIWPASEADGGGWVGLLAYAPSADPVPPAAAESADIAKAAYRLDLPASAEHACLEGEAEELRAHGELGTVVLLQLHLPTAAPSAVSRGNGYTPPGWLILTHAASAHERETWLRSIRAPDERDPSTT
jgi:hypothetical protein